MLPTPAPENEDFHGVLGDPALDDVLCPGACFASNPWGAGQLTGYWDPSAWSSLCLEIEEVDTNLPIHSLGSRSGLIFGRSNLCRPLKMGQS